MKTLLANPHASARTAWLLLASLLLAPVLTRADALDNWTSSQVVTTPAGVYGMLFSGVAYGNGRYVAVGEYVEDDRGLIQTSEDGVHWTLRSQGDYSILDLYDVTFGNGVFVAVGWDWFGGQNIYHSTNGVSWTSHHTAIGNVYRVCYGAGTFVAVGDGSVLQGSTYTNRNIYTSPDGITWTARNSGSLAGDVPPIRDVACGPTGFLAVDNAQHLYRSGTGATWTRTSLSGAGSRISFCHDRFLLPAGPGTNLVSTDGATWVSVTNTTGANFGRVVYADGCYLALSGPSLFTSLDATNWLARSLPSSGNVTLTAAAYGNRRFVPAGYSGGPLPWLPLAYVSDPTVALGLNPGFPLQLQVSGIVGKSYRIDQVNDLRSGTWQPANTFYLSTSPCTWSDPHATNACRFYRAVLLP